MWYVCVCVREVCGLMVVSSVCVQPLSGIGTWDCLYMFVWECNLSLSLSLSLLPGPVHSIEQGCSNGGILLYYSTTSSHLSGECC